MNNFELNFDEIKENGYITEAGVYEFTIAQVESKMSKSGNPMLVLTLDYNGSLMTEYLPFQQNTLFKYKQVANAIGLDTTGVRIQLDEFANMILGKTMNCKVEIVEEEYLDPQTFEQKKVNKAKIKSFIKSEKKVAYEVPKTSPVTDDDLPF